MAVTGGVMSIKDDGPSRRAQRGGTAGGVLVLAYPAKRGAFKHPRPDLYGGGPADHISFGGVNRKASSIKVNRCKSKTAAFKLLFVLFYFFLCNN